MKPRIVMLGAAPQTRGTIASVVEAYRLQGLFKRWPLEYIATHGDGGALDGAATALRAARRLAELLARNRGLAVHAHCTAGAGFWREAALMGLAAAARSPLIVHLQGGGFDRFYDDASTPARAMVRGLFERAACVIAPSEAQRAWARGIARNARVACVPHPVPVQEAPADAEKANMVLFLGRLDERHGLFDLLEALVPLRGAVPDVRLVCAGEGDRAGAARYAERLGVGDAVRFTGWVGPSGKRALFESAAAFALPSYRSGLPLGLLEAMAAGVPVVGSTAGGMAEAVAEGVSGFLVPPGDTAALARALRKVLLDRALGERIGAAARETLRLRFSPERAVAALEGIYADAGVTASAVEPARGRAVDMRKAA